MVPGAAEHDAGTPSASSTSTRGSLTRGPPRRTVDPVLGDPAAVDLASASTSSTISAAGRARRVRDSPACSPASTGRRTARRQRAGRSPPPVPPSRLARRRGLGLHCVAASSALGDLQDPRSGSLADSRPAVQREGGCALGDARFARDVTDRHSCHVPSSSAVLGILHLRGPVRERSNAQSMSALGRRSSGGRVPALPVRAIV